MYKEKVQDDRLHKDLIRTRSGRTQLLRKDYGDRKFTSEENADVVLTHDKKEMYVELIDDEWYWVNGCSKCEDAYNFGESYSYQVCYEHDICVQCGINRDKLTETPWGHQDGFMCKDCADENDNNTRKEAFQKFEDSQLSEWDFRNNANIVCPHCGTDNGDAWEHGMGNETNADLVCHVCDGEFSVEIEYQLSYTTSVIGERVTQ